MEHCRIVASCVMRRLFRYFRQFAIEKKSSPKFSFFLLSSDFFPGGICLHRSMEWTLLSTLISKIRPMLKRTSRRKLTVSCTYRSQKLQSEVGLLCASSETSSLICAVYGLYRRDLPDGKLNCKSTARRSSQSLIGLQAGGGYHRLNVVQALC